MNKSCLFESLNHQNIDDILKSKEQLKLYIEKCFSCNQLLSLMCEIDSNAYGKMALSVRLIARKMFYEQFETNCDFDTLNMLKLLRYLSVLEDEYDGLKYQWDEVFKYEIINNKVFIKSYIGKETELKIPRKIKGFSVFEIADNCFRGNNSLTNVEVQADIEEIPSYCFYFCSNLKKVVLSNSVKIIESCAFCGCDNLEEIQLGKQIECIDFMAFYECKKIKDITLPNSLRYIYEGAFNKCKSIRKLYIPSNVQHIGYASFMQTFSKTTTIICERTTVAEQYAQQHGYKIEYYT